MSFGLTNAPATFQRLMNDIFRDQLDKSVEVFIDDIGVHSNSFSNHIEHLRFVFEQLRKNKLFANPAKCSFAQMELEFAAHRISNGFISMEPGKIQAIRNWKAPSSVSEVRQFIGFANFYRRFIQQFAKIASPLYDLTKEKVPFVWSQAAQAAFEEIKAQISSEPILRLPEQSLPFIVRTDASLEGLGAVLSQIIDGMEHPIAFESRRITDTERNYPIRQLEFLAILHAIRTWRHYLFGRKFTVYSDHESLSRILVQKDLDRRLARWIEELQQYDCEIKYTRGENNSVADTLSRFSVNNISTASFNQIRSGYEDDQFFAPIWKELKENPLSNRFPHFTIRENLLFLKGDNPRLCIPEGKARLDVLKLYHSTPTAGHQGIERTYEKVRSDIFWPKLYADVRQFVSSCLDCQKNKSPNVSN